MAVTVRTDVVAFGYNRIEHINVKRSLRNIKLLRFQASILPYLRGAGREMPNSSPNSEKAWNKPPTPLIDIVWGAFGVSALGFDGLGFRVSISNAEGANKTSLGRLGSLLYPPSSRSRYNHSILGP